MQIKTLNELHDINMKSSEINQLSNIPVIWGVEVDEIVTRPPLGLRQIGLLWDGEAPDMISDNLIDSVISFSLAGVEVIVEIRPEDRIDHDYMLVIAANAGFCISAIPPERKSGVETWSNQCARFADALMAASNFSGNLYPVSGYLTYLVMEYFGGAKAAVPSDLYTRQRFAEQVPQNWSDIAKSHMRKSLSDAAGGENELKGYLGSILKAIHGEARRQRLQQLKAWKSTESQTAA